MSLAALDDIAAHTGTIETIEGVVRIETSTLERTAPIFMAEMRSLYPHDEVFGQYCTVNAYVDCPPDELFEYMRRSTGFVGAFALVWANSEAKDATHLHGGDAVGKPLIGDIERNEPTQAPPDTALTDSGRDWGENFSSMPTGRVPSCCAISQLNFANVSDAGMPA